MGEHVDEHSRQITLAFGERAVAIRYPAAIQGLIAALFGLVPSAKVAPDVTISVAEVADGRYTINSPPDPVGAAIAIDGLLGQLSNTAIVKLVEDMTGAVALHAGAVLWKDRCILVPGASGAGKTSLVAWLLNRGCRFLSDEVVILSDQDGTVVGFPRALVFKAGSEEIVARLPSFDAALTLKVGTERVVRPRGEIVVNGDAFPCGLIVFPQHVPGAEVSIVPLSAAKAGLRLMAGNANAGNFEDGGLATLIAVTQRAPAFIVQYGELDQLDGYLDMLAQLVLERSDDAKGICRFLAAFGSSQARSAPPKRYPRHPATSRLSKPKKLTIGMATYDDYDGVYFTIQALRIYHAEVMDQIELLVVDNHPDGPCAKYLKDFEQAFPNYRYVPVGDRQGTTVKEFVFREAAGDYVLCIDCHVLIMRGGVKALIDYFDEHPDSRDLVQGPRLYDDLSRIATHWDPVWKEGMFGTWHTTSLDEIPKHPIEIQLQGMGLFACRRAAWVGFNPAFRGFGGEEWYTHEKFRRAGDKVICLPELLWVHRFERPMGSNRPRPNWEEIIRNYAIGFRELNEPTDGMEAHFRALLGEKDAHNLFEAVNAELDGK